MHTAPTLAWPRGALLDNSAWARLHLLSEARAELVAEALRARRVVASLPLVLEAGFSARSRADHERIMRRLDRLPWASIDGEVQRHAQDAQRRLARVGHHRVAPMDLLLAAIADRHRLAILHYDRDYDLIAERTDLRFASIWLAGPGTLW